MSQDRDFPSLRNPHGDNGECELSDILYQHLTQPRPLHVEYVDGRTGGEKGGRDFYHLGCPISAQPLLLELPTRYLFPVGVLPHYEMFVLAGGVAFSGRGDIFMCWS